MSDKFDIRINIDDSAIDPNEVSFWVTIAAITLFVIWGTFVVFYFSRVSAIFLTFILDKYLRLSKNGIHFKIGSISISGFHSGKVMFRNVIYDNGDMTIKINDGHLVFKYWKAVEDRHLDLKKKRASRLQVALNGLHVNIYNNLTKYAEIARIRRFDWFFENSTMGEAKRAQTKPPDTSPPSDVWENIWNLLGVVNVDVSAGCILVGNKFLPYALWTRFENLASKITVGESVNDRALLTVDGETENVAISLVKNEQYKFTSKDKEPPRTTGNDGFPILQSASLDFSYKQDLLGYVTEDEPQSITSKVPVWSSEWKFGDNTVVSYGPWAEQQRFLLYTFFFPPDYQNATPTAMPKRGQKRVHIKHDAKIIMTKETCIDIWFMRSNQLESIRTRCGPKSNLDVSVLWITTEKGFYSNIRAEFLNFETTTTLVFTKLIECQKFCLEGSFFYPLTWNGEQTWTLDYTFTKAAAWFVWDHKRLFSDLVNDWIGEEPADITKFVPFRVFNRMRVVDSFEVIMLLNECNWVDTSDMNAENVELAIVGEKLSFDCELPFIDFLPQTQKVKYLMKGERGVAMRAKFPPNSATEPMRAALCRLARCNPYAPYSEHGTHSLDRETWFEMWRTELVEMKFDHQYRPVVLKGSIPTDIPYAVISEYISEPVNHPWDLEPDYLGVELIIEGSDVKFTGLLIKLLFELKNNYFGWYDSMTNIDTILQENEEPKLKPNLEKINPQVELFRTMNVDVTVRVCNIRAEMLVYSPAIDPDEKPESCPIVLVEEVCVEVKKTKTQALIQVGVSPACAYLESPNVGSTAGCITLSGLQFRGHAMYSEKDVAWEMGLVEYGWIMEILVGDITGTLDFPSHLLVLHQIVESLLMFIITPDDATNVPEKMQFCQHGNLKKTCLLATSKKGTTSYCKTEEEIKYRQIRISVDSVDLSLAEEKTVVKILADPVRVTVCNSHEGRFSEHVCVRVPGINIRQAVKIGDKTDNRWVEGASIMIEGISLDIELPNSLNEPFDKESERYAFIKKHDSDTKRLHFLWIDNSVFGCACYGNTHFFGEHDDLGAIFMESSKKRKFFVPGIEKNPNLQPRVLQSVIEKNKCMLTSDEHQYYKKPQTESTYPKIRRHSSNESFHSAKSQQASGFRILQSGEMSSSYAEYVTNVRVEMPVVDGPPLLGEPGAVSQWCHDHPATVFIEYANHKGINELNLASKHKKAANVFNVVQKKHNGEEEKGHDAKDSKHWTRKLAITGTAATSLNVFVSPIGIEGIERMITAGNHSISAINPCLLVHTCYRDCAFRKHRQPLTESLFNDNPSDNIADLEVSVDLPRITFGLFQCAIKKNVVKTASNEHITANLVLVLVDKANIQSKLIRDNELESTNPFVEKKHFSSTLYQLNGTLIAAQLLQLTDRGATDFGSSGATATPNNWDQCAISKRMSNVEPRVMLDFNISDTSVILERRPTLKVLNARSNTVSTPFNSPGGPPQQDFLNRTPTPAPPPTPAPLDSSKNKTKVLFEHYLKAVVGSVTTSIVMARPQELTAGDEFPIYEAIAPVMVSWLSVADNFVQAIDKLIHHFECWKSVAMAKVLKLALDCTEDKVAVKIGKNRMSCTRVLCNNQASCPSCLLLKTLFRWFAFAKDVPILLEQRISIRPEFEIIETRKTALMALLSHWQSDVAKELKLASCEDAHRFKVSRPDEVAIVALTKNSKREMKKKLSKSGLTKKETRIVIDSPVLPNKEQSKLQKRGRMSPAPLLKRLRLKSGGESDAANDSDTRKNFGDIEMQEIFSDSEIMSNEETEDEFEEEEDEMRMGKKDEQMDLYTWMRNAQRDSALKRRKNAGVEHTGSEDSGIGKGYINPMDIQQKAYYFTLYRWAQLQWTTLDSVDNDHWHFDYSVLLREVDVRMMAKSVKNSTDHLRQYITPSQQKMMQIRNAAANGTMLWTMERDERRKIPLYGEWNIKYNGNIEGIRFLIGMATVSLGKELSLVFRVAMEAKNELKLRTSAESTPKRDGKRWSMITQYNREAQWDEKVLDMTKDYEKHMQRMKTLKDEPNEKVRVVVDGNVVISSVVLESVLNDLYVSAMILKIDLNHSKHPPLETIFGQKTVTIQTVDEKKASTLTRKNTSTAMSKIDDISLSLTKMSLTLSESDSLNKKSDILRCTLNSSSLNLYTKYHPVTTSNLKSSTKVIAPKVLGTWATLKLGSLEGNMPMAAYSLHDVVMRHGKELEQQFNRLSSQPATTPLGNAAPFPSAPSDEPLLKITERKNDSTSTAPTSPTQQTQPTFAHFDKDVTSGTQPAPVKPHQIARRVPIAVVSFIVELTSIEMNIQLLPSLQAKYRINRASSSGITGDEAKWTILLDEHFFEFCVTGQARKTDTFRLLLPSVKCTGHYSIEQGTSQHKPSTDKKLVYREGGSLQMTVLLGSVNHVFTTELLNQLMFAEQSFRTELTSLINRIRSSSINTSRSQMPSQSTNDGSNPVGGIKLNLPTIERPSHNTKPPLLFTIKVLTRDTRSPPLGRPPSPDKASTPWLQLTAATPTQTAIRLTIDSLEGELTNKWVVQEEGSKERIYGSVVVHFNAKLGQLIQPDQYEQAQSDMQEYATFMTQVRVENKERNMLNSSYSYHVSLNRPVFLVKAAAIDKAILLWLNYKNTYDYWRNEREKIVQTTKKQATANPTMFSPTQIAEDADMNLSLAINNGMYMCMPLYSHDVTEGMPALVLSLQKSELSVLVKKELTCKASFNGFKMSFVDDFDEQALTQSFLDAAHSEQSNCFFFPEGTYELCSKATASSNGPAKWVLSVSAEMQGVEIDLDQRIGKLAKLLVNTFSMIGKDYDDDMSMWEDQGDFDSDEEKVEGAAELKKLKTEERVPWMENKMHEHSRTVFELAARGKTKKLETEQHKLRQYELIRFKAFRRNIADKLKRGGANNRRESITATKPNTDRRSSTSTEKTPEPDTSANDHETVNFNLDVKVKITSGTCTLRTAKKENVMPTTTGGRDNFKRLNIGTSNIKALFEPPTLTTTTFSIPSVEMKAYHVSDPADLNIVKFKEKIGKKEDSSKNVGKESEKMNEELLRKSRFGKNMQGPKKSASNAKRGCFYMFIGLSSMPTETVVTPHLATYFEQVLEPLPPSSVFHSQNMTQEASIIDDKNDGEVHNIVAMDTTAFPLDFVLYLDVQSSTIRFDGKQQTSRNQAQADCLLTLPRLTLELSSQRNDNNADNYVGGIYISGQFKGFSLKIFNPLEPELDSSRALQLSLDLLSFVISRNKNSSTEPDNRVRFVFSSQIGKASFEYNFRRLGELIQFPKPWYRAAIARRVFFGDQAAPRHRDEASDITGTTRSRVPTDPKNTLPALSVVSTASSSGMPHQRKPWTALVLAAVQWNEFEVVAFMSNTMGKTTWNATKGLLWADAKLNSLNERDVSATFELGSSELCAKEGAISGVIKLNKLKTFGAHSLYADVKKPPVNKAKFKIDWITTNIEWMSRRVLVAKWTLPKFKVSDFFNGVKEGENIALSSLGMNVEAAWKDLQVVITKTTVDDIVAIVRRLISFIDEQMKNSRILLGSFNPATLNAKKQAAAQAETRKPVTHFWEKVLDYVSEMQFHQQLMSLMEQEGVKVGGHVQLKAGGISLVLMKGDMNADTWAVFHLRDACISFDPEARMDFLDPTSKLKIGILLKQTFCLQLGSKKDNMTENFANVCRVQTRFNNSRHISTTEEILEYFVGDVMRQIGLHHERQALMANTSVASMTPETTRSLTSAASFARFRSVTSNINVSEPLSATNHSVMELFQFPGLEAKMTSEQLNGVDEEDKYESVFQNPMEVSTTFVCDFFSEVAVETNFNAQVSFLPELLKDYLKDNPAQSSSSSSSNSAVSPSISTSKESTAPDTKDPRVFFCREWKVEPRVRFIDRIKWTPPVIDEILRKLQIFDHRNTIPKVIQRTVLDPLDATLASSVIASLQLIDDKKTIKNFKKSRSEPTQELASRAKESDALSIKINAPTGMNQMSPNP